MGWITRSADVFDGGVGIDDTDLGFSLSYSAGTFIASSDNNRGGSDPIAIDGVTIPGKEMKLPNDIHVSGSISSSSTALTTSILEAEFQ